MGAIVWNIVTWLAGIPSSSSHALIGGLVGAGVTHSGTHVVVWAGLSKTVGAIFLSPALGLVLALLLMLIVSWSFVRANPSRVDSLFRKMQFISASLYSLGHGGNDAQKTMGIITALLFAHGALGGTFHVPFWVVLACQRRWRWAHCWRLAHRAYYGSANHPARAASGRVRGDSGVHHLVPGDRPWRSGIDDPHDHGRDRGRRRRAADFGGALERGERYCYRLGDYDARRWAIGALFYLGFTAFG